MLLLRKGRCSVPRLAAHAAVYFRQKEIQREIIWRNCSGKQINWEKKDSNWLRIMS